MNDNENNSNTSFNSGGDNPGGESPVEAPEITPIEPEPTVTPEPVTPEPAVTPETAIMSEPITMQKPITPETPFPAGGIPLSTEPAKKSKGGLIALIVVLVVLLFLGGGTAAAYFILHSPENLAVSAVVDLMNSKNIDITGSVNVETNSNTKVQLDLTAKTDENNQSYASTNISFTQGTVTVKVGAESVLTKDYELYLKANELSSLENILTTQTDTLPASTSSGTDIHSLLSEADGKWWKVSVPEIIDSINELDNKTKTKYKESYTCATTALNKLRDNLPEKYIEFYKKNPFIKLENVSGEKYKVLFDAERILAFSKDLKTLEGEASELTKCFENIREETDNSSFTVSDLEELTLEDIKKSLEDLPEITLTIKNTLLGGEVSGISIKMEEKTKTEKSEGYEYTYTTGMNAKADFKISKTSEAISVPSDSKSITELVEKIINTIQTVISQYQSQYLYNYPDCGVDDETECASLDPDYYDDNENFIYNGEELTGYINCMPGEMTDDQIALCEYAESVDYPYIAY